MARGNTFSAIRDMIKAEIGDYSGNNTNRDAELYALIANKQLWLATEYAWPFLERRWDVGVAPGTQYVNLPTLNDAGVTTVCALLGHHGLTGEPKTHGCQYAARIDNPAELALLFKRVAMEQVKLNMR